MTPEGFSETESALFWHQVFVKLKRRDLQDIFNCCADQLSKLETAVARKVESRLEKDLDVDVRGWKRCRIPTFQANLRMTHDPVLFVAADQDERNSSRSPPTAEVG